MLYVLVAELVIYLSIMTILATNGQEKYVKSKISFEKINSLYTKESDIKKALEYYIIDHNATTSSISDLVSDGKLPDGYNNLNYLGGTIAFEVVNPYYVRFCENFSEDSYKNMYLNYYKFKEGSSPIEDVSGKCPQTNAVYRYIPLRQEASDRLKQ